jgi:hypothetical protein
LVRKAGFWSAGVPDFPRSLTDAAPESVRTPAPPFRHSAQSRPPATPCQTRCIARDRRSPKPLRRWSSDRKLEKSGPALYRHSWTGPSSTPTIVGARPLIRLLVQTLRSRAGAHVGPAWPRHELMDEPPVRPVELSRRALAPATARTVTRPAVAASTALTLRGSPPAASGTTKLPKRAALMMNKEEP